MGENKLGIVLHGCGGFAFELAALIGEGACRVNYSDRYQVTDIVSDTFPRIEDINQVLGYCPVKHQEISAVENLSDKLSIIGIGSPQSVKKISSIVSDLKGCFGTLIHSSSFVSRSARIGVGVILFPHTYIGPHANVGNNSIINTLCTVGHDVILGNGSVLGPNVQICGEAKIGKHCFLGAGTIVNQRVSIGQFCKVASGVTLSRDVSGGNFVFNADKIKKYKVIDPESGVNSASRS